jgi:hypothetical protein
MGLLDDDNPQLFRRTGIIAAFDSLVKRQKKKKLYLII